MSVDLNVPDNLRGLRCDGAPRFGCDARFTAAQPVSAGEVRRRAGERHWTREGPKDFCPTHTRERAREPVALFD